MSYENPKCPNCHIDLMPFGPATDYPLPEGPNILHWKRLGRCYECGQIFQYDVTYCATSIRNFKKVEEERQ